MEFINLTRAVEIGANSYALRSRERTIILDAGMHPKIEGLGATPDFGLLPEGSVDAILLSHAHQDHVGSMPVLTRREPGRRVFMTEATARIADVMLHNSANVMLRQKEELNLADYPLFTHRGVELSREAWQPCKMRAPLDFSGDRARPGAEDTFEFFPAGHILGAAGILIHMEGRRIFYTGDVSFEDQTLVRGADFPKEGVDVLIMETTRGNTPLPQGFTRAAEERRFAEAITAAFERGGSVMVPVFALGKTQEILGMLWELRREGLLPAAAITIGGLGTKISTIYDAFRDDAQRLHPELSLLEDIAPHVLSGRDIAAAFPRKHGIFALSSGMMTENTLSNIFARRVLGDPRQSLFFVGYSDPESPAGRIRAAEPGADVLLDSKLPPMRLDCPVREFQFSAHAHRDSLLEYALALRPKKILLVHGDRPAIDWFHEELRRGLPETEIVIPAPGISIPL